LRESESSPDSRPETPDVSALTRAMVRGDEAAYRMFYDAYFDRLLRYLLVVTGGNEAAAREALQGALVRVARHIKAFDAEDHFWSWLTVLARSALADDSRKQRRWFAFLERFSRHAEIEQSILNNGAADRTLHELLAQKVASLPPEERELITQKYFLRRSVREIAAAQQNSEKAVESKLTRVRRKLKDEIISGLKNE
jgi:RNA polymerase sigma-70 factor (ECF subfamily)